MADSTTTLIEQLDEAREVAERHRLAMLRHLRLARYWQGRVQQVEAQLPGLVQAEEVAGAAWERD
ncbi:MAG: hypothetical protein FOGNACKC_02262 [Anaerolineae bacterium]|nr:hypothetical protein [Anaerolineae bacterium]